MYPMVWRARKKARSIICNSSKNIPTIFVSLQRYNFDLDPLVDVPIQYIYERIKLKSFQD